MASSLEESFLICPNINLDIKSNYGSTPFIIACRHNTRESVLILLNDARVDINCRDNDGYTGLIWAASYGYIAPIEYILASMRHIQSTNITNAINKAGWENRNVDVASLLEAYQANPFETVKKLRSKLKWQEYGPVNVFVYVILLSDQYYALIANNNYDDDDEKQAQARQFFQLMLKLPMEMQMVVCNRMFDLPKDIIKIVFIN